jgi:hypothetical protein
MSTTSPQVNAPLGAGAHARRRPPASGRAMLRLGAIAGATGVVLELILQHLHPHHEQPNHSVAAFTEYAHAHAWTAVHIGQFLGTLMIALALLVLSRALAQQSGAAGGLARAAGVVLVLVVGVFAVQMAVDGIALKHAVDDWASATGTARTSAFQVADSLRWLEKGLSGFFNLLNGIALLTLGISLIAGRTHRAWPGWIALLAGAGFLAGGVATATGGFSPHAGAFLEPALPLLVLFLAATYTTMWRQISPAGAFTRDS